VVAVELAQAPDKIPLIEAKGLKDRDIQADMADILPVIGYLVVVVAVLV
jgi:hypothetical protein